MYLKITSNDEQVYAIPAVNLAGLLDRGVDSMECSMTLSKRLRCCRMENSSELTQPSTAIRMFDMAIKEDSNVQPITCYSTYLSALC